MVGEIYRGEFFMDVSDRGILKKPKKLTASLPCVIRPLISKLLNFPRSL